MLQRRDGDVKLAMRRATADAVSSSSTCPGSGADVKDRKGDSGIRDDAMDAMDASRTPAWPHAAPPEAEAVAERATPLTTATSSAVMLCCRPLGPASPSLSELGAESGSAIMRRDMRLPRKPRILFFERWRSDIVRTAVSLVSAVCQWRSVVALLALRCGWEPPSVVLAVEPSVLCCTGCTRGAGGRGSGDRELPGHSSAASGMA